MNSSERLIQAEVPNECRASRSTQQLFRLSVAAAFYLAILLSGVNARADVEGSTFRLSRCNRDLEVGPGMDARDRDLHGCSFVGRDLRNSNFDGAVLAGSYFHQCDLRGASFRSTSLTGAKMGECYVTDADFTDAVIAGIVPVPSSSHYLQLSAAQFESTSSYKLKELRGCTIVAEYVVRERGLTYDFSGADLLGAIFPFANYNGCDFSGARIDGLRMGIGARVDFAVLSKAASFDSSRRMLRGCQFELGRIEGRCDFSGMQLYDVSFSAEYSDSVNLSGTRLQKCSIQHISTDDLRTTWNYRCGDLSGLRFAKCDFSGCNLTGMDLAETVFDQCNLKNANMSNTVISRCRFAELSIRGTERSACAGLTVEQIQSTWNFQHDRMHEITLPRDIHAKIESGTSATR